MTMSVKYIDEEVTNLYDSNVIYTVAAAALATGVSTHRLRTWERRYGVPAPGRGSTGRRMYTEGDLALIRRMAALVASGLSAASAASAVHDEAVTTSILPAAVPVVIDGVLALVDAAQTYDESLVLETLNVAESTMGIESAIEHLVLPALVEAGKRWERMQYLTPYKKAFRPMKNSRILGLVLSSYAHAKQGQVVIHVLAPKLKLKLRAQLVSVQHAHSKINFNLKSSN